MPLFRWHVRQPPYCPFWWLDLRNVCYFGGCEVPDQFYCQRLEVSVQFRRLLQAAERIHKADELLSNLEHVFGVSKGLGPEASKFALSQVRSKKILQDLKRLLRKLLLVCLLSFREDHVI